MAEWFTEAASDGHRLQWKIRRTLYQGHSPYQTVTVLDTEQFGVALVLDGIMQTTAGDEFIYHEMLAYIALNSHLRPRRVLVIGGGDGGLVRDVLKDPTVEQAVMVEIDPLVVEVSKKYLPGHAAGFGDPRLSLVYEDGVRYLKQAGNNSFDIILVDSTDPEGGPGQVLYTAAFHREVRRALRPDGLYIQHTGAPFYNPEVLEMVSRDVATVFPLCRVFWTPVPSYPGAVFTFVVGSLGTDPTVPQGRIGWPTRWYTEGLHRNAFSLPPFLQSLLPEEVRAEPGRR
jgi:spermidine synthase